MSLLKTRRRQLKEYMAIKRDEVEFSGRLVSKYKERSKKDLEYSEFKRSLVYTIDNLFSQGKTKIVIQPRSDKLKLYDKLVKDIDFTRYYECEVTAGQLLEIKMRGI